MKRPFFRPLRVAVMFAAALVVLVALTPLGLYVLGLNNVDGRPLPLSSSTLTPEDEALLERTLRVSHPITVERLTPWAYVTFILADSQQPAAAQGARAAWFIAQNYNAHHLKDRRVIWWPH